MFSAGHLETIARFREGEPYRVAQVEDFRQALVATGLVSTVAIRPVARPGTDLVDLAVAIEPAPMRTIAGEAGYGTGEGVRLELSWQHRNLLPPEGAVTFRGVAGTREQLVSAILRRNNFMRRDQVLNAQVAASHVDRPAYDARMFTLTGGIERQSNIIWQKAWTWSVGAELVATDERDVDIASGMTRRRTFFIGAIPAYLGYDGSNDLLDPTRGLPAVGALLARGVAAERQLLLRPRAARRQLLLCPFPTPSPSPGGLGSARSSERAATGSRRRGASMRAAAARCAATASRRWGRATRCSTIRSADGASSRSRSRRE